MRITSQLLRSKAHGPLQAVEYLDLSNLGIGSIEKLNLCSKLCCLILRGNSLYEVFNLEVCPNLWRLDLSNNEIKSIDCLAKFVALGTVNLANNDLSWHEVGKLRNLHIIDLSLHGNPQLERDPYYRIHVIDCLPNVWMLDGRLITSAERLQVKHFFQDSALTDHPVRHKLSREWFVPSSLKQIQVHGVYGVKATHLMTRFPANGTHNIDTDRRRLNYAAYSLQEDLVLDKKYTNRDFQVLKYRKTFLEDLLEIRPNDREKCNMLLILLVSSLEFILPTHLVKETLETAKLSKIGKVYTMDLFLLPKEVRCRIVSILLSAVKIDKDDKEDGGLYDKLYLCLFYTVAELMKLNNSVVGRHSAIQAKVSDVYRDYQCLLASELVQLLCIVPAFFEYVDRDVGVMNLVVTATGDVTITEKIGKIISAYHESGGEVLKLYEELSDFLLQRVQEQSMNLTNKSYHMPSEEEVFNTLKALPMKSSLKSPIEVSGYHTKGVTSPDLDPPQVLSARKAAEKNKKNFPHLGDYLLLGPQTMGKIISLPQPFVALVEMDSIPSANGAMETKLKDSDDHFTYINMDQLAWDIDINIWKPKGSIGDSLLREFLSYSNHMARFTVHTVEDLRRELNRRTNATSEQTPRPNSPEEGLKLAQGTPRRDNAAPLIFSTSVSFQNTEEQDSSARSKRSPLVPRPMSSLLKEKLDLKLEMTKRAQSAMETRSSHRPLNTPDKFSTVSQALVSGEEKAAHDHQVVEGLASITPQLSSECVHCALEEAMIKEHTHSHSLPGVELKHSEEERENVVQSAESETENACTNKTHVILKDSQEKEETDSLADKDEPELQELEPKQEQQLSDSKMNQLPPPSSAAPLTPVSPQKQPVLAGRNKVLPMYKRVGRTSGAVGKTDGKISHLSISIPQVEIIDSTKGPGDKVMSLGNTLATKATTKARSKSGRYLHTGKSRPFSAMDAYKYILDHPRTKYLAGQATPPPQRPSSPESRTSGKHKGSAMSVTHGTNWLGGGRDLYWESLQKRPNSSHVPGWKEGLPENMKRPRSAVAARTLNRQSRTSTPVTPSSLHYDAVLHGRSRSSVWHNPMIHTSIPEPINLSDYHPLYHQLGLPRRLGTSASAATLGNSVMDFYTQPTQDAVYRTPPSSPIRILSPGPHLSSLCMQCIYEDLMEESDD
ncbi:hypothetical protein CHS0354_010617 [Potamilus streckersoni]|uniref:Uncharacterized protein n=1 Tax=Potamilus streckersoni TaxID=2493646 RepID=A0AAE0SGF0_9BIVA|nr:hypothetical protein CHS0354_010617 [Potamilus streckersoni]